MIEALFDIPVFALESDEKQVLFKFIVDSIRLHDID